MEESTLKRLSIQHLGEYLGKTGVSEDAIQTLKENKVSGLALLLLNESELVSLLPTIGDRAIVRTILNDVKGHGSTSLLNNETPLEIIDSDSSDSERMDSSTFNQVSVMDLEDSMLDTDELSTSQSIKNDFDDFGCKKLKKESVMKVVPILSKRGHEPPLPRPFDVPQNFPQTISTGLISHKLTGKPRAKFITIIAQSIYRHKSYPTDEEYIHVAQELVKKWPFLDGGKGIKYLVVALRMRMAYLRKPDNKKRGNPSKEGRKYLTPKPVMPSTSSPLIPVGKDEASQQRHEKILKAEMKKANPNKQTVKELMRRSFFQRRRNIVDGMGTVQDILIHYPALKNPEELIREFCRVMEKEITEEFLDTWSTMVPKILDISNDNDCLGLRDFLEVYLPDEISDEIIGA